MPCHDQCLIPLQAHRRELEPHGRICLLDDTSFSILTNKFKTAELARSVGVPVPREEVVASVCDAVQAAGSLGYPVVLKPQASYLLEDIPTRHGVRVAENAGEVEWYADTMLVSGSIAVQEYVEGVGVGLDLLLKDGQPLLAFQHVRVHEIATNGSTYRKGSPLSPHLLDDAVKLLGPLRYTGVAMAEFRENPRSAAWALMEVNTRFWGSLPLSVASGADFPAALFQMLVEGKTDFSGGYRTDLYCRNLALDFEWLADVTDRLDSARAALPVVLQTVGQAAGNLVRGRERSDALVKDDIVPGVLEVRELLHDGGERVVTSVAERAMSSRSVRARLHSRVLQTLGTAESFLFVCKGNICRSPFAEHLAQHYFPDRQMCSAGFYPKAGRECPEIAVRAAQDWGVDLRPHRSRVVDEQLVNEADVILVFDWENFRRARAAYPSARDRIFPLGAVRLDDPLFIPDPYGKDRDFFERTYRTIASAVQAMVDDQRVRPTVGPMAAE
jgi:protein-tyrosine-phosphatase